jgi:hypothetical protein
VTFVCFLYLFFAVPASYKGDQLTAWRAILEGEIGTGLFISIFWLGAALAFGAFAAAVLGVVRQAFRKSQ